MEKLLDFLYQLDDVKIFYCLSKPSSEPRRCIMVEIVIPGERWEVEFFEDGEVLIEVYRSKGIYSDEQADDLIKQLLETNDPKWTFENPPPPIVLPEIQNDNAS